MDSTFEKSGYPDDKVLHYHGRSDIWQCSRLRHARRYYDNETAMRQMADKQVDMKIPEELVPYCPICGAPMQVNKRTDEEGMAEDDYFKQIEADYHSFLEKYQDKKTIYLEIGVGNTRPEFIKEPFQQMATENPNGLYVLLNYKNYRIPAKLKEKTIQFSEKIEEVLRDLKDQST